MNILHKEEGTKVELAEECTVLEYHLNDKDINVAVADINGRYPLEGRIVNEVCKEIGYIIEGEGIIVIEDQEIKLKKGSAVLINSGERYYWEGKMKMLISCTPEWYPEQHRDVE
ncbi:MAG: hypothetical protein A2Y24_06180 [Clostridiales bacterium GWE2_32_10]|nr:MAG: hypothetical protein A2Y24_06180 [Clostridiales bacterium GWE2_32_10]HBY20584.1 hypothetical protein [Clostridiales bacterium]